MTNPNVCSYLLEMSHDIASLIKWILRQLIEAMDLAGILTQDLKQ